MNPAHLIHTTRTREPVSTRHGRHPDVPYFPEGGVAAPPDMIVSPLTKSAGNGQSNELIGPAIVEWEPMYQSYEQGHGVPPFKRWPRQFHSEAYNFDSLDIMPHQDQVGPIRDELVNRPVKAGWSVPRFYEQFNQFTDPAHSAGGSVGNIRDPAGIALALGWGYIGG